MKFLSDFTKALFGFYERFFGGFIGVHTALYGWHIFSECVNEKRILKGS